MDGWTTERVGPAPFIALDRMGAGVPVFFLHGVGGNRTNWHGQLPAFARHFESFAWDARGYGGSDDYDGALEFSDFARDLARVMDHFAVPRAHLVGLSMGGLIALDFYFRLPDRVRSLTLCDTGPGIAATMSADELDRFLGARLTPLRQGKTPAEIAPANARNLVSPAAGEDIYLRLRDSLASVRAESYMKALEATARYVVSGKLEAIDVPVLVVCGKDDKLTPPAVSEIMHGRIRGSTLALIEDAGHVSNMEQATAFNRAVLAFLLGRAGTREGAIEAASKQTTA